jgi:hypothetical protein
MQRNPPKGKDKEADNPTNQSTAPVGVEATQ